MTESMKKSPEPVSSNEELSKRLNSAGRDELMAMAKEQGIVLERTGMNALSKIVKGSDAQNGYI